MDPLLTSGANRGFPRGFSCGLCAYIIVIVLWTLAVIFYYSYVHMALVFTQTDACSSFTALTVNDVPFYSYPASPALDPGVSELYCSFEYYIWASDYLLFLLPVWTLSVTLVSVVFQSRTPFLVGALATIVGLIQLAKAIYWTLYLTGALHCEEYQFCINRDPGQPPDSPNAQFCFATISAYVFAVGAFALIGVEGLVRSARLPLLRINKKFDDSMATGAQAPPAPERQRSRSQPRKRRQATPPPPAQRRPATPAKRTRRQSARSAPGVVDYPINV